MAAESSSTLANLQAADILEPATALAHPGQPLSKVLSRFGKSGIGELPVVDSDEDPPRLLGLLCLPALLRSRRLPLSARVENLMVHPPRLTPRLSLLEVARRLLVGDFRALPVTDRRRELVGMVSRHGLLARVHNQELFDDTNIAEVMTPEPRSLLTTDSLNRARTLMRTLDVRTLPVVDQAGRLVGVVGYKELLAGSELSSRSQPAGDRSGNRETPHLRVESLMHSTPVTIGPDEPLAAALQLMLDQNVSTLFVIEGAHIQGVLQTSDLLELLARPEKVEQVHLQLSGLETEDPLLVEDISSRLQHALRQVAHNYQPLSCHLHFSSEGTTSRTHFTVRTRLQTDKRLFTARGEGWSELTALKEALQRLESQSQRTRSR